MFTPALFSLVKRGAASCPVPDSAGSVNGTEKITADFCSEDVNHFNEDCLSGRNLFGHQ